MMTFDSNDDFRPGYRYLLRNTLTRTIKPVYTITCHSRVQTIYYSAEDVCKCHTIVPGTWNIQVSLHFSDWNTTFNFFAVAELSRTNFDVQNMSSVMLPTAENLSVYEFSKAPTCKVELTQRSNVCAHANVIIIEWHVSGFQNQIILHGSKQPHKPAIHDVLKVYNFLNKAQNRMVINNWITFGFKKSRVFLYPGFVSFYTVIYECFDYLSLTLRDSGDCLLRFPLIFCAGNECAGGQN